MKRQRNIAESQRDPMTLAPGYLLRLRSFNSYPRLSTQHNPKLRLARVGFKAKPGRIFVALLLGIESQDEASLLDVDTALRAMGYVRRGPTTPEVSDPASG